MRRLRLASGLFLAGVLLVLGPFLLFISGSPEPPAWYRSTPWAKRATGAIGTAIVGAMGVWLVLGWRIPERLRRRGLTESEARRFAYEAPLSRAAFWSRPSVAVLLDEAQPAPRPTRGAPSGEPTSLETRTMVGDGERRPGKEG